MMIMFLCPLAFTPPGGWDEVISSLLSSRTIMGEQLVQGRYLR